MKSRGARELRKWIVRLGGGSIDRGARLLGERVGLDRVQIYNLVAGRRMPYLRAAVAIEAATKIPPRAWFHP
jgi:hypothetical protein